ncbi:MAG: cytochrome b/b6 domain-containing protein [Rhodocyclales bacterium]|nr:cytochrome b/b6 domain-containing protein [Rhodocyclales bacterium]
MGVKVWDPLVRIFHWTMVSVFFANYFFLDGGYKPHDWLGYAVLALLALRVVWGFVGTRHARFADFVPTPGQFFAYVRDALRGRERRYVGHNPAAAAMVLTLMLLMTGIGVTGWMHGLDRFWGEEWVVDVHVLLCDIVAGLVVVHVSAAILVSFKQRENLIMAMITGYKD